MTGSYCPKCNKDQPTIVAGTPDEGGAAQTVTQYYQCAVCRTPVGVPRALLQQTDPMPAFAPPPLETSAYVRPRVQD